jgi:hypothetical protein
MTVRSFTASTGPGVQAGRTRTAPWTARAIALLLGGGLAACAPSRPAPVGLPSAATSAVPAPPVAPSVTIAAPSASARYTLRTTAWISTSADTMQRADTLITTLGVSADPMGAAVALQVDSFVVSGGEAPPRRLLSAPLRATARVEPGRGWVFVGPDADPCRGPARAALDATRDLWVRWPATVLRGQTWADTAQSQLCRDGIPLQAVIVRHYTVEALPSSTQSHVIVRRRTQVTMTGEGRLRGDATRIRGDGSANAILQVDPRRGWIDLLDGDATLTLTVAGSTRTQQVTQRSRSTMQRAPDTP